MVCHGTSTRLQHGSGIVDTLMKPFTYEKYPGERHAYSLSPATFMKPMSFMGPGTRLDIRLNQDETPKNDSLPVNKSDYESYKHDLAYKHAKEDYLKNPTPENKKIQMKKVWYADDNFIDSMKRDTSEPMAPIAGKLIQAKEIAEKTGIMDTKRFSGFGIQETENDPVARLRDIVKQEYKTELKHSNKNQVQKGGIAPLAILAPIAIAAASALAKKGAEDLYDWIKKKITSGSGIKIPYHRTKQEKIQFIKDVINKL